MSAAALSLAAAALAPNLIVLAVALSALGMFAAIYHPVGTADADRSGDQRGRSLAFNGVCGNLGVVARGRHHRGADRRTSAGAAPSWCRRRSAWRLASSICALVPDDRAQKRRAAAPRPTCRSRAALAATIFGLFIVIGADRRPGASTS